MSDVDKNSKHDGNSRHYDLFNHFPVGLLITPLGGGKVIDCNEYLAKMLAYSSIEACIAGYNAEKHLANPEDRGRLHTIMKEKGLLENFEAEFRDCNGKTLWISSSAKIEGDVIIGTAVDITARKEAEDALKESESKFRAITENAVDYIFIKDSDRRYTFVNQAMKDLLGLPENEILGKTPEEVFGAKEGDIIKKVDDRTFAGETVNETRDLSIGANQCSFNTIQTPLTVAKNKVTSIMGIVRNVTERKRAEEELLEVSKFREFILSEAPVGITIYDAESGQCLAGNRAIAKLVGASEEQVLAQNFYTIESWKNSGLLETAKSALKDNSKKELEVNVTTTFGKEIWFHCYFVPFLAGEKRYLLFTLNDFTEYKQMETQLRQSEKMQAVGQLAGGIAHDFNNQLAGIVGYADMLREELANSPELSRYADNILLATKRASDLTSQLLAFAHKGKYLSVEIDIHKIIGEVAGILQRTINKDIIIKQHLDAQQALTLGDPTQIQNAIMNIALNARDAMPNGGELIFTTSIAQLDAEYCKTSPYDIKPGNFVQVSVTDNGTGMDETTQKKIFEPFFTTKKQGKGTGMGLASVYGTVKNHGGAINVYSEPGQGTTLTVYLSGVSSDMVSEKESSIPAEPVTGDVHILLVDDEEFVLDSGLMMLEKSGNKVSICRNGKEAIEFYKANWQSIDLVILDMVMPEMSGKDTFLGLKKINPKVLVLLSSGYSIDGEAQKILDEGVKGFIQKPYLRVELSQKVAELLSENRNDLTP